MLSAATDARTIGHEIHSLAARLFPICRSITGDGLRETLRIIGEFIPLEIHEVPSGTQALDWTIPDEWNIRDAWIKNSRGERLVDFQKSNLHMVNYSTPVRSRMSFSELKPHLFTIPDKPNWIPYRTTYYKRDWGFCLAHSELQRLTDAEYEVGVDSTLAPGSLSYGECFIPGNTSDEFLISCHCCHPSLANDNLSGISVAVALARTLADAGPGRAGCPQPAARDDVSRRGEDTAPYQPKPLAIELRLRYSYRFLFIPGTIGAITWLARES
jgi:aminopeptidase-like protein